MKPKHPHEGGTQATGEGRGESYTELPILSDRIDRLGRDFEHWWLRELRWHRERYGPGCGCRACRWGEAA